MVASSDFLLTIRIHIPKPDELPRVVHPIAQRQRGLNVALAHHAHRQQVVLAGKRDVIFLHPFRRMICHFWPSSLLTKRVHTYGCPWLRREDCQHSFAPVPELISPRALNLRRTTLTWTELDPTARRRHLGIS